MTKPLIEVYSTSYTIEMTEIKATDISQTTNNNFYRISFTCDFLFYWRL